MKQLRVLFILMLAAGLQISVVSADDSQTARRNAAINKALARMEKTKDVCGTIDWNDTCFADATNPPIPVPSQDASTVMNPDVSNAHSAESDQPKNSAAVEITTDPVIVSPAPDASAAQPSDEKNTTSNEENNSQDNNNDNEDAKISSSTSQAEPEIPIKPTQKTIYGNDQYLGSREDLEMRHNSQPRDTMERSYAIPHREYYGAEPDYFHLNSNEDFKLEMGLHAGYRHDKFNWNIANSGGSPNILSELTWKDLQIYEVKASGDVIFPNAFVIDGSGAYGEITKGKNQDSDYAGDDRTAEFSRSNNRSDDGQTADLSAGLGYRLNINEYTNFWDVNSLFVTPLAGYSYHKQNLQATDGVQTLSTPGITRALGPFDGLNSHYDAEWQGPWVGFKLEGALKRLYGLIRFEYHWVNYYAQGDWNLRDDLQHPRSFEHSGRGDGIILGLGCSYALTDSWSLDFDWDFKTFSIEGGVDRVFPANSQVLEQRLNEVNWNSWTAMLGTTYRFGD